MTHLPALTWLRHFLAQDTRSDALTDTGSDDTPSDMGDCRWETETSDSLSVSEGAGINIVDEFCEPSPVQASNEAMRRGVEIHAALGDGRGSAMPQEIP